MLGKAWLRIPPVIADAAIALFFVVISQIELHHKVDDGFQAGPMWLNVPLVFLMSAPLAFRRRWPEGVLIFMTTVMCVPSIFAAHTIFFWGSLVPLAVAVFTVARHRDGVVARYAWVVAPLMLATAALHVAEVRSLSNVFFAFGLYGATWGAGRLLRRSAAQRDALADALGQLAAAQAEREEEAVSAERRRIAAEMHDVVAHAVSLMTVQAGAARMQLEADGVAVPPQLRSAEETGRLALAELRRTLGVMRSAGERGALEPTPDLASVPELVERFRDAGLDVSLACTAEADLPASVELAAYRIVQEALTNVLKHAGKVRASVSVQRSDGSLVVAVENAPGSTEPAPPGGHGLAGMRERAVMFGGRLAAGPTPAGGFSVVAQLPLAKDDAVTMAARP